MALGDRAKVDTTLSAPELSALVYRGGVAVRPTGSGWAIESDAETPPRAFRFAAEAGALLGQSPCATKWGRGRFDSTFLLLADGIRPTEHVTGSFLGLSKPGWFQLVTNATYPVLGLVYHTKRLLESYLALNRELKALGLDKFGIGPAWRAGSPEPYFEFDAALVAARRVYETSRHLIWKQFGTSGSAPRSFDATLQSAPRIPEDFRTRLESSWTRHGTQVKRYRDCLLHNVPLTKHWSVEIRLLECGVRSVRVRIPDNPGSKSSAAFSYEGGLDALDFAIELVHELVELQHSVILATASCRPWVEAGY